MIDLYTWGTPNGRKISIALEELELAYEVHPVDISKDEQFDPAFLKISPNNKIPAMWDRETGLALFESGAILLYLAEATGKLMPQSGAARWTVIQWLMWQMGGQGPMLGQANHFLKFNKGVSDYAEQRYQGEAKRLWGVLDRRLAQSDHVGGPELSIADVAIWPWCARFDWQGLDPAADFPHAAAWFTRLRDRPAFRRGYDVPTPGQEIPVP